MVLGKTGRVNAGLVPECHTLCHEATCLCSSCPCSARWQVWTATDWWIGSCVARARLSRFLQLTFSSSLSSWWLKGTEMVEYWHKNLVLKLSVEGLFKCIPLLCLQMVHFKIWSELMATISKFQVGYKLHFKENYAVFLNYFQILKSEKKCSIL